ncbi:MAG TPA: tetratricopeptide repeat protein, partial [Puia sp.]|nr:tetratricopeptide repeat protein [Puia sp.]
ANCLDAISDAYDNLGNYPKSLENSLQSLKIYETLGNAGGIRRCLGALGNLYAEQGDYRKALEYSFRAKEMSDNNEGALSIHLLNIGDDYNQLKIFDSARIYNQQSYDLAMRSHNTDIIGCALTNLGETHMGTSENSLALEYLRLAIPHLQEAVDDDILCEAYMQMAMIFAKTGKRDSCLHFAQLSFATAQKSSFTKRMYDASSFLARYYKDHKNVDSAFAFQQIQMNMKDSLFSQEKVKEIENLTFQEKLRQQEIAEEKQRAEKERKNNLQLMGISAFIVSFLLLFMLIIRRKTNSRTVEFFGVVGLLLVFEFISLFIHPYIEEWTGQAPVYMLVILVSIAAILAPIHHGMEKFVKAKMAHKIGLG